MQIDACKYKLDCLHQKLQVAAKTFINLCATMIAQQYYTLCQKEWDGISSQSLWHFSRRDWTSSWSYWMNWGLSVDYWIQNAWLKRIECWGIGLIACTNLWVVAMSQMAGGTLIHTKHWDALHHFNHLQIPIYTSVLTHGSHTWSLFTTWSVDKSSLVALEKLVLIINN